MTEPAKSIRVFIAINLPPELKARLAERQRELKSAPGGQAVRWTPVEQIHLTLRFLGDVPAESVPDIQAAVQRAAATTPAFELQAEGLGCFPHARQPRIVWVGITGALAGLRQLQEAVERETAPWGEREDREFHPHLTIGRVKKEHARSARPLAEALNRTTTGLFGAFRVAQLDLMQSRLAPTGAEYTVLAALPLAGNPNAPC